MCSLSRALCDIVRGSFLISLTDWILDGCCYKTFNPLTTDEAIRRRQ